MHWFIYLKKCHKTTYILRLVVPIKDYNKDKKLVIRVYMDDLTKLLGGTGLSL